MEYVSENKKVEVIQSEKFTKDSFKPFKGIFL